MSAPLAPCIFFFLSLTSPLFAQEPSHVPDQPPQAATQPTPLLTFPSSEDDRSPSPCCLAPALLSCLPVLPSPSLLTSRTPLLLPGSPSPFTFSHPLPPRGLHYRGGEGEEATLSLSPDNSSVWGSLRIQERVWSLERCGEEGHAWLEYDVEQWSHEEEVEEEELVEDQRADNSMVEEDTTTIAEFSVMVYYTPQMAEITPDLPGYVDQVIMLLLLLLL